MSRSRKILLVIAKGISHLWRIIPGSLREQFITGLYILESRGNLKKGLGRLFLHQDKLQWVINERAMAYGNGEHPKHRLTQYHDFFCSNIKSGDNVLDIGCGYGAVSRSIAKLNPSCTIIGVDRNSERLAQAKANNVYSNLSYIEADVCETLPSERFNVVVLSNVLEHIDDRVGFLKSILSKTGAQVVLIRVPNFERDWTIPLRKEINVDYFSDEEHFVEHTLAELNHELGQAGLNPVKVTTLWGEIWSRCELVPND